MLIGRGVTVRRTVSAMVVGLMAAAVGLTGPAVPAAAAPPAVTGDYMLSGLAGKCMDIAWGDPTSGTAVNLFTCNGTPAQRWHFDTSTGEFTALGKCLDIPDSQIVNGNHLWIWDCNGSAAQRFQAAQSGGGYVLRPLANTGMCVEVAGGVTDDWTPIQTYQCNGTASQLWHFAVDQTPDQPPVPPKLTLATVLVSVHQGSTVVTRNLPAAYLTDQSLYEDGMEWYQRINGGAWTAYAATGVLPGVDGSTFVYPTDDVGKSYEYKVVAHDAAGTSESAVLGLPPVAPTGLWVVRTGPSGLRVGWADNSGNETGFRLTDGASAGSPPPFLGTLTLAANTTGVPLSVFAEPGASYCFLVTAFNALGTSGSSLGCITIPR